MNRETTLEAYAGLFEDLSPDTLGRLDALVTDDVVFRDPFHDLRGRDALKSVLAAMLRAVPDVRFRVADRAMGASSAFLSWSMTATFRGRPVAFDGATVLGFSGAGPVNAHVDHWDAASAVHARIPLLGCAIRAVNRRIAAAA